MNIFIAAHYNLNNGDRAVLESTVKAIKRIKPDSSITVSSVAPLRMKESRDYSVVGWPFNNKFSSAVWQEINSGRMQDRLIKSISKKICNRKYLRELKKADIVLVSGGHHLTDILGKKSYYHLCANFLLPIYLNKEVHLLPQSIGPAENDVIVKNIKAILELSASVAFRDFSSEEFINSLNGNINAFEIPDLVYRLSPRPMLRKKDQVAVALYHSYSSERRNILDITIPNLESTIKYLLDKGRTVKIVPMDQGDDVYYEKIKASLDSCPNKHNFIFGESTNDIQDTINQFAEASCVIAYKTHASVFSMISETPLVGVAYHPKTIEFMNSMGLMDYAISDRDATADKLIDLIEKIEINYDEIRNKEHIGVAVHRSKIEKYLTQILNV